MIKRANRLRLPRHIKRAYERGKGWQGKYLRIKSFFAGGGANARLAVVISKKSVAKATGRNLIRRRIKAAIREHLSDLRGWDIVVSPKGNAKEAKFDEIAKEINECVESLQSS